MIELTSSHVCVGTNIDIDCSLTMSQFQTEVHGLIAEQSTITLREIRVSDLNAYVTLYR